MPISDEPTPSAEPPIYNSGVEIPIEGVIVTSPIEICVSLIIGVPEIAIACEFTVTLLVVNIPVEIDELTFKFEVVNCI